MVVGFVFGASWKEWRLGFDDKRLETCFKVGFNCEVENALWCGGPLYSAMVT